MVAKLRDKLTSKTKTGVVAKLLNRQGHDNDFAK